MRKRLTIIFSFTLAFFAACCPVALAQDAASVPEAAAVQRGPLVLTVDDCVKMGLESAVDVVNARMDAKAARLQKQEALAEYFPSISATGLAFHALNPLVDITITDVLGKSDMAYIIKDQLESLAASYGVKSHYTALQHGYSATLSLTQPVFAGGRIINGNRLAKLGVRAADTKASLQNRTSAEEIQKLFYQVLALQQKQDALDVAADLLDNLRKDVSAAVDAGLALTTDLSAVDIKLSQLEAGRSKLRLGIRIAKMNLLNNIGMPYNPYPGIESQERSIDDFCLEGSLADVDTPQQAYVPEEAVAASLDETALLQMQVEAKVLERRMTLGQTLPSLLVGTSYGYSKMLNSPSYNGVMYAMLRIPITDWGKNARKLERQQIEVDKARNQRDFLQSQLILQVRQLYMELCSAYDQVQISASAMELSERRLSQLRVSYSAGVCTLTELLSAQNDYSQAREAYIDANMDYLSCLDSYRLRAGSIGR